MAASRSQRPRAIELFHRANAVGLTGTAFLPGACVVAVAATMRGKKIRESRSIPKFIGVDSVADPRAVLRRINENSSHSARSDIDNIVDWPPSLRKSCQVAGTQP